MRAQRHHFRAAATVAGLIAIAALGAGCSSSGGGAFGSAANEPTSPQQRSFSDRFTQLFSSSSPAPQTTASGAPNEEFTSYCPTIDVRQGAATLSVVGAPPKNEAEAATMALRYQGTLGQTARECSTPGGNFAMKIGVQGRIILGPQGTPGTIEVPLRYALIQEGPEPKTIWTKLYRFPVTIGEGQASVPFTHVQEDLVVPKPSSAALESYIVYIGFDTMGMKPPAAKPAPKRR